MKATPTTHDLALKDEGFRNLAEALDYAAGGRTGYNFYSGQGRLQAALPYQTLRDEARSLAGRLLALGLPRGARVALVADTSPDFVRFFFACQYAGMTPVPLPAKIQLGGHREYTGQLERLLSICQASVAIAGDGFLPFLEEAAGGLDLRFAGSPQAFAALPASTAPLRPQEPDELAYLQYTSGSTRFPRGVMITQQAVLHNARAIIRHGVQIRSGDRAVSWLPYYHDMGLVGLLLTPLVCQISVDYLNTRDFAMRPRLWLKLLSENRGTISFSPPFGYDLAARRVRDDELAGYDLRSWRVAGVGAEMIRPETLARFAERLAPSGFSSRAFLPCYGMAECSLAVCFAPLDHGVRVDRVDAERLADRSLAEAVPPRGRNGSLRANSFVTCGQPLPECDLEIRDEDNRVLPERRCGTVYVRGPSLMTGYFNNAEATAEVLSADGWLDTGDLAYRVGDEVVIVGRSKDTIIVNGRNILPQDIEYLAESQPGVRTGDTTAFPVPDAQGYNQAVLLVECRETGERERRDLVRRISQLVRTELGIDCVVELVERNTLIRTTSGKPSRRSTRKAYLQHQPQVEIALS